MMGVKGPIGPQGERGLPGPRGRAGEDGRHGEAGTPGVCAWSVAGACSKVRCHAESFLADEQNNLIQLCSAPDMAILINQRTGTGYTRDSGVLRVC